MMRVPHQWSLPEELVKVHSTDQLTPPLFGSGSPTCPRCEGAQIRHVAAVDESSRLEWRECEECTHLWGTPHPDGRSVSQVPA